MDLEQPARGGVGTAAGQHEGLAAAWNPTAGVWTHVAYARDADGQRLYVDGTLVASAAATLLPGYDTHPVVIGNDIDFSSLALPWSGRLRDVRLWNTARSGAQILGAMNATLDGSESGLAALWPLDDGTGATARNAVAGGAAALLGGTPAAVPRSVPVTPAARCARCVSTASMMSSASPTPRRCARTRHSPPRPGS